MAWGRVMLAAGFCAVLGGCGVRSVVVGAVGTAVGGAVSLGQTAVGAVGSALGFASSGVQAAGSAAVSAAGSAGGAVSGAAGSAGGAAAGAGAGSAGASATAAGSQSALPAGQSAALTAPQVAETVQLISAEAAQETGQLLSANRPELDRCALLVFRSMSQSLGFAAASRWAGEVSATARSTGEAGVLAGLLSLADRIGAQLRLVASQARQTVGEVLGPGAETTARDALTAVSDMRDLCPSGAAARLVELSAEEEG